MKNIGFIKAAQDIEQTEQMLNLMKEHGCVSVHVEEVRSSNRSRWQDFVDGLDDYDIAVLYSFVEDKVDSNNLLFSGTTTKDVFDVVCKMFSKRDRNSHDDIEADLYSNKHSDRRLKRYRMVINMYNAGYSVKEIMERTGYRGKSNVYRILHLYDVSLEYPSMSRSKSSNDIAI